MQKTFVVDEYESAARPDASSSFAEDEFTIDSPALPASRNVTGQEAKHKRKRPSLGLRAGGCARERTASVQLQELLNPGSDWTRLNYHT